MYMTDYEEKRKKEEEKKFFVMWVIGLFFTSSLIEVMVSVGETKKSTIISFIVMCLFVLAVIKLANMYLIEIIIKGVLFYKKLRNTKLLSIMHTSFYSISNNMPQTKKPYYVKKANKDFVQAALNVLNTLPKEYEVLLKKYPTNFNFEKIDNEDKLGRYEFFDDDLRTSEIKIFHSDSNLLYTLFKMRSTIFHELGHHLDMVLGAIYYEEGENFSVRNEFFLKRYEESAIFLDEYFLSSPVEFFAETVNLYLLGDLGCRELEDYYDDLFKTIEEEFSK